MEAVGSGLDGRVDDAAFEIAELCRRVLRDQIEFLDCIRRWCVTQQVVGDLVVIHAIEQEIVGLLAIAIDERTSAITAGVVAVIEAAGIGRDRTRREQCQLRVIA